MSGNEMIHSEFTAAELRAGAVSSAEGWKENESTSQMPLVVWLRGDEPFAGEFNLDADAAMNLLGIKRSRLTQISGRELRVGRIRIDRYIRPMYRKSDIDEYLSWTRATASHLKSSDVLIAAANELREESKEVISHLDLKFRELSSEFGGQLNHVASETYRIQRDASKLLGGDIHTASDHIRMEMQGLKSDLMDSVSNHQLSQAETLQDAIAIPVSEILSQTQSQNLTLEQLASQVSALQASVEAIKAGTEIAQPKTIETARIAEELFEMNFDSFAALKEQFDAHSRLQRGVAEASAKTIEMLRDVVMGLQRLSTSLQKSDAMSPQRNVSKRRVPHAIRMRRPSVRKHQS
jgi:hypothetical protein